MAQAVLDTEYEYEQDNAWKEKERRAEVRVMSRMAVSDPLYFARGYILNRPMGSHERKIMAGVLKFYNPEYYELNQFILGEADELDLHKELEKEEI